MLTSIPRPKHMTRNARRLIEEVRRLIARPRGWTRNAFEVSAKTDDGSAYCLSGAINRARVNLKLSQTARMDARAIIEHHIGTRNIPYWNDVTVSGKQEIVRILDDILKEGQ